MLHNLSKMFNYAESIINVVGMWIFHYLRILLVLILVPTGCMFRKPGSGPSICSKGNDVESPYYRPLQPCIGGTRNRRWIPIEERRNWPSRANLNKNELAVYGNYGALL